MQNWVILGALTHSSSFIWFPPDHGKLYMV